MGVVCVCVCACVHVCVCAFVRVCVCWCEGPVVGVTSLLVAGQERTYYRGAVKEGGREQL